MINVRNPFRRKPVEDVLERIEPIAGQSEHETFLPGKPSKFAKFGIRDKQKEEDGKPIFLMIGSLSGASRKDAESYARGLADEMVKSVELARIHVFDDKMRGRMIYEIHEGGPQLSVAEKVADALETQDQVQIALANDIFVSIERTHDQIFTLIHNRDDESGLDEISNVREITEYLSDTKLSEIYPDRNGLAALGGVLTGISLFAFLIAGTLHLVVKSGATDPDALFSFARKGVISSVSDNPVWQLEKARQAAEKDGRHLKVLRKDARGWNWEFQ